MISSLFSPLSFCYSSLMRLREQAYNRSIFPSWEPKVPCISVGNISWGGTGKTPFCGWLLNWARQQNLQAVLLTRGYKSRPNKLPYLVLSDSSVRQAGDEALLLAQNAPWAKIIVDSKRSRSGRWAMRNFLPDLFILDDGFQHLAVKRHLNFVLFSPYDITDGWNRVLPSGTWREGKQALCRADAFLLNTFGRDIDILLPVLERRIFKFCKPVFIFYVETCGLWSVETGKSVEFVEENTNGNFIDYNLNLKNKIFLSKTTPYILVTGIAEPRKIIMGCQQILGQKPSRHLIFPDHHFFTQQDIEQITATARQMQARIVCTQKDAVKLAAFSLPDLFMLDIRVRFITPSGFLSFEEWLLEQFSLLRQQLC